MEIIVYRCAVTLTNNKYIPYLGLTKTTNYLLYYILTELFREISSY